MNAKKIAGFLVMRPAFTQRNLTSVGLVALFFVVYILMGGKVTTELPKMNNAGAFGSGGVDAFLQNDKKPTSAAESPSVGEQSATREKASPKDVLGINQSEEREARRRAALGTTLFTEEERKALEKKPIDRDGLVQGVEIKRNRIDWNKRREERELKKRDNLSDIEERLNLNKRK